MRLSPVGRVFSRTWLVTASGLAAGSIVWALSWAIWPGLWSPEQTRLLALAYLGSAVALFLLVLVRVWDDEAAADAPTPQPIGSSMNDRTLITIRPGNAPDGTYNVHEPLPYPFHVDAATGEVGRQDFWKGQPFRVLGFQTDAEAQTVDLRWEEAAADPERIKGMFAVLLDTSGDESTIYHLTCPITDVTVTEKSETDR